MSDDAVNVSSETKPQSIRTSPITLLGTSVLLLLAIDLLFLYNLFDYYVIHGDDAGHHTHFRPFLFADDYRHVLPPMKDSTFVVTHALFGASPLILTPLQVWDTIRKTGAPVSVGRHRWIGRFCILSALVSAVPAAYLGTHMYDNGSWSNFLVVLSAVLWAASGALAYYFIRFKKNIRLHRNFATRFAVMTHALPVIGRIVGLVLWAIGGRTASWSVSPLRSSVPELLPIMVNVTFMIMLPTMELLVWLEEGGGSEANLEGTSPISRCMRWKKSSQESCREREEKKAS
jgi:hypothetical protein